MCIKMFGIWNCPIFILTLLWGLRVLPSFVPHLPRILDTQPLETWRILLISQGLAPECASSMIFCRVESGSGRPLTYTPPNWFTPLWPEINGQLSVSISYILRFLALSFVRSFVPQQSETWKDDSERGPRERKGELCKSRPHIRLIYKSDMYPLKYEWRKVVCERLLEIMVPHGNHVHFIRVQGP